MTHREMDESVDLRRLLASLNDDIAETKQADVVPLAQLRALTAERDKVIAELAAREQAYP